MLPVKRGRAGSTGAAPRYDRGGSRGVPAPAAGVLVELVVADGATGTDRSFQYLIEFLGSNYVCDPSDPDDKNNCSQYRITVRSPPDGVRAFVQLQSYYLALPR
jgi:Tfp pilus assembly protein PilX